MTWTEHDILEPVDISTNILPTVGQIRAFAFAYGTTEELNAVAAIAPGFVQGMGPSKQDEESWGNCVGKGFRGVSQKIGSYSVTKIEVI